MVKKYLWKSNKNTINNDVFYEVQGYKFNIYDKKIIKSW